MVGAVTPATAMKTDNQPINLWECVCVCARLSGTSINPVMNAQTNPHRRLTASFSSACALCV